MDSTGIVSWPMRNWSQEGPLALSATASGTKDALRPIRHAESLRMSVRWKDRR